MKYKWLVKFVTVVVFFATAASTKNLVKSVILTTMIFVFLQWLIRMYQLKQRKKLRNSNLEVIDTMEGIQFERYLFELFSALGYKVKRTAESGDFGADLILNDGDRCTVVQAKRYKGTVGIKAVQEALGAKAYYDADCAWVVTNSSFTNPAVELADRAGIALINRMDLADLMASAGIKKPSENEIKRSSRNLSENKEKCPLCSSPMVLRKGKFGVFYGCSTFPKCKGIKESK